MKQLCTRQALIQSLTITGLFSVSPNGWAQSDPALFSEVVDVNAFGDLPLQNFYQIEGDKQLNLFYSDGLLRTFRIGPATPGLTPTEINVFGGSFQAISLTTNAQGNFLAGDINQLALERESYARIDGGAFASVDVTRDSEVLVTGGVFGDPANSSAFRFTIATGSSATITGGTFDMPVQLQGSATLTLSGGQINRYISTSSASSQLNLVGGEYAVAGNPTAAPTLNQAGYANTDVVTATLEDGTVIIFTGTMQPGTTLGQATLPPADTTPIVLDHGVAPATGLRPGQTLTLRDGGSIADNFSAARASLNIQGGVVGDQLKTAYTDIDIAGGQVGSVSAFGGSVAISDGELGSLSIHKNAIASITGGAISSGVGISSGAALTMSDGTVAGAMSNRGGTVDITGGSIYSLSLGNFLRAPNKKPHRVCDDRSGYTRSTGTRCGCPAAVQSGYAGV
jgi:hypothetical protein